MHVRIAASQRLNSRVRVSRYVLNASVMCKTLGALEGDEDV
jgi:hypothetical protein